MSRKKPIIIPFEQKIKYVARYWLKGESAYELGKEICQKKLTSARKYKCCLNHPGELRIYQWVEDFLRPIELKDDRKVEYKYCCTKKTEESLDKDKLIEKNRELEKLNKNKSKALKRKERENNDLKKLINILKEVFEESGVRIDKDKVMNKVKNNHLKVDKTKISNLLGFSRRSLYESTYKPKEKQEDPSLVNLIKKVHNDNFEVYGRPKLLWVVNQILAEMKQKRLSDYQLYKIMKQENISSQLASKNGRKDPKNTKFKAENLIKRKWKVDSPYKHLFTDITYLALPNNKYLYISVIIDTFNYQVLAWNASLELKEDLVIEMLKKIKVDIRDAIIHTDHGVHYSAHEYQEWIKNHGCSCSMSCLGNSLDNYPIEHHFSFLKRECLWRISSDKINIKLVNKLLDEY
ncbi:MAG: IS3 family transposase, partial [Mycoplasmataceae bacterium]|nr:IS3 family transposase [Mycoplasmataceae bacterium]